MIISNKDGIYQLPYELLNDLRLTILGNYKKSTKSQHFVDYNLVPSPPPKIKTLLILAKTAEK